MPLINCKIELKHKWTNYCVLSANGNDNANDNDNANNYLHFHHCLCSCSNFISK